MVRRKICVPALAYARGTCLMSESKHGDDKIEESSRFGLDIASNFHVDLVLGLSEQDDEKKNSDSSETGDSANRQSVVRKSVLAI